MRERFLTFIAMGSIILLSNSADGARDSLKSMQHIAAHAMDTSSVRMRVSAENMANSQSPNYVPKHVVVTTKRDRPSKTDLISVKRIVSNPTQVEKKHDPHHPLADPDGFVTMPKVDPLVMMVDIQQSRLDHERAMRAYQAATEQRNRLISMMGH